MVAIRNQKEINISNLGDSGFIIIRFRNGEAYTAARSKEQQHSFNIPFQLSILPGQTELDQLKQRGRIEELKKLKNVLKKKDNMCQDTPEHSDEYCYEILDEDIIISATDGVFDNLFSHEILQTVKEFKEAQGRLHTKEQAEVTVQANPYRNQLNCCVTMRLISSKENEKRRKRPINENTKRPTTLLGM